MRVFTGDISGAGTDSNVFCCLYGDKGDSGERELKDSATNMNKFERNKVSSRDGISWRLVLNILISKKLAFKVH